MSKLNQYKSLKKIGEGSFGEVFLVQKVNTNEKYVLKKIDLLRLDKSDIEKYLMREISIMEKLRHKNIVRFYENFEENNSSYILMEYCNGGTLGKHLEKYKEKYKNSFPPKLIQIFARQIVEGLAYIHSKGIIHRDLKLDNILLNFKNNDFYDYKDVEIKIIDFGLSTFGVGSSLVGSPNYMDPRILEKYDKAGGEDKLNKYDEKADIWSLGAICYEMLTGENLFKANTLFELVEKAEKGIYYLPLNFNLSTELISFLNAMLQYEPKKRASAKELLQYPFLTKNISEFTSFDYSRIAYKIKNGNLIINFIYNETLNSIFNPQLSQQNNTIEINLNKKYNPIIKYDDILKRELKELLDNYEKARIYFNKCKLNSQEEKAKHSIEIIAEMQKNLKLGQPVDLSKKPKIIKPEYIYGCSTKERNEIFILLINAYKQKREQNKNLDEQKLKNLDYIISSLEKAYKEEWAPPPKYRYENNSILNPNEKIYQIRFDVKRADNLPNLNCYFVTSLMVNSNKSLVKKILLKPDNNLINAWIWQINETDWKNIINNEKSALHFNLEIGINEKYQKFVLNVEKEKLAKPATFNITQLISNNQKIIINFSLALISSDEKKSVIEQKKIICEKIYPPFESINFISKSSVF